MEIQLWRSILCPYELAVKELTVKFQHIIEEHRENDSIFPYRTGKRQGKKCDQHPGKDAAEANPYGADGRGSRRHRRGSHHLSV